MVAGLLGNETDTGLQNLPTKCSRNMSSKASFIREESPPLREAIVDPTPSKAVPLVICGPSGSGKSSIIQRLLLRNPNIFQVCISRRSKFADQKTTIL
ncbi:unnamed protein product [Hymenolepis diminuta]|uniref:GuKc domain-containing protein n=1 Tax=Hymenolepis diminuta TaxID=6216 RepID=A0A0R3SWY5_HYMDI|nr:unnamed protein product [Hymenolepis diminuta]